MFEIEFYYKYAVLDLLTPFVWLSCTVLLYSDIIKKYKELDLKQHFAVNKNDEKQKLKFTYKYQNIRNQILEINSDIQYVTDVLVKYLYEKRKSN